MFISGFNLLRSLVTLLSRLLLRLLYCPRLNDRFRTEDEEFEGLGFSRWEFILSDEEVLGCKALSGSFFTLSFILDFIEFYIIDFKFLSTSGLSGLGILSLFNLLKSSVRLKFGFGGFDDFLVSLLLLLSQLISFLS